MIQISPNEIPDFLSWDGGVDPLTSLPYSGGAVRKCMQQVAADVAQLQSDSETAAADVEALKASAERATKADVEALFDA